MPTERRVRALRSDALDRLIAGVSSAAVVALAWMVLLFQHPIANVDDVEASPLRLRFIPRERAFPDPAMESAHVEAASHRGAASHAPPMARPTSSVVTSTQAPQPHMRLYERDGRLRVPEGIDRSPPAAGQPPGSAPNGRQANARGPFDRVNPVEYRETRFDRVWRGKGTAGDVALENAHGTVTGGAVSIPLGTGDQPARARPPPPVRFNPALHERTADLGSDATGDAYKAAPIAEEPAPGLEGAASRAIRGQLALLGQDFAHCKASLFADFARPVRLHLSQLEGIEYAFAHGADPVRAEHLLPREADMAYTLARRALWHARKKLASCDR
ncbi:MAG: hypothetical protein QM795_00370 [Pseudoxanthomonas sp.]